MPQSTCVRGCQPKPMVLRRPLAKTRLPLPSRFMTSMVAFSGFFSTHALQVLPTVTCSLPAGADGQRVVLVHAAAVRHRGRSRAAVRTRRPQPGVGDEDLVDGREIRVALVERDAVEALQVEDLLLHLGLAVAVGVAQPPEVAGLAARHVHVAPGPDRQHARLAEPVREDLDAEAGRDLQGSHALGRRRNGRRLHDVRAGCRPSRPSAPTPRRPRSSRPPPRAPIPVFIRSLRPPRSYFSSDGGSVEGSARNIA